MPYRQYGRANPRRYITHARLVTDGRPEGPAVLCLALLAVTWTLMGVGVATGTAAADPSLVHTLAPQWLRVTVWVVPAVLATYTLATGRRTTVTVVALSIAPWVRIGSYMWAWVMYLMPGGPAGIPAAWYPASFHAVMFALVILAAVLTRTETHDRDHS